MIALQDSLYGNVAQGDWTLISELPNLKSVKIYVGGDRGRYIMAYDPEVEHELVLDNAPEGYSWSSLYTAVQQSFSPQLLPFDGFMATANCSEPRKDLIGFRQFRHWMSQGQSVL